MRLALVAAVASAALLLPAALAAATLAPFASRLGFEQVTGAAAPAVDPAREDEREPVLILAQRAIDRSWGPSEDTIYVEKDVPGWRSEGFALAMSAVLPGAGQVYNGENMRGLWFALAEGASWITRGLYRHRGHELRDMAGAFSGVPADSNSSWSFTRWQRSTGGDPAELEALWSADREAFYDRIATDTRYSSGWSGDEARTYFTRLREVSDDRLRFARYAGIVLWVNHLTAAVDALRAARLHNVPLTPTLGLKIKSDWRRGRPAMVAAIVRRF